MAEIKSEHYEIEEEYAEGSFRQASDPIISDPFVKARVGTMIFIISEVMLFGGLISSFFIVKNSYLEWPPENLPSYPIVQTLFNTLFLFLSGVTIYLFDKKKKDYLYFLTLILGSVFILLQGVEWIRLINYGLTMTSDRYGSIFYLVVGAHALHALVGIIWLAAAYYISKLRYKTNYTPATSSSSLFWKFVVLIWPVIYVSVYII